MTRITIFAAALALAAGSVSAQTTVRMGTEGAYPPYNFINDKNQPDGYDIAVGNEICKRAELTCEWVMNDWDSIIPNLVSGNYDTIIAAMTITEERRQVIAFTQAYFPPDPSVFVAPEEDFTPEGKLIAAQTGTIQAAHVAEIEGATLVEFATPDETVAAVRNGEADAVLADKGFLEPIAKEDAALFIAGEDVMLGEGLGIGLRQSDTELLAKMDAALTSMKEDGTLAKMMAEWFDGMESPY